MTDEPAKKSEKQALKGQCPKCKRWLCAQQPTVDDRIWQAKCYDHGKVYIRVEG